MYSKSISTVLASLSLIIIGCVVFIKTMSFDYGTMQYVVYKAVPAAILLGGLGFMIGSVLDYARFKK